MQNSTIVPANKVSFANNTPEDIIKVINEYLNTKDFCKLAQLNKSNFLFYTHTINTLPTRFIQTQTRHLTPLQKLRINCNQNFSANICLILACTGMSALIFSLSSPYFIHAKKFIHILSIVGFTLACFFTLCCAYMKFACGAKKETIQINRFIEYPDGFRRPLPRLELTNEVNPLNVDNPSLTV